MQCSVAWYEDEAGGGILGPRTCASVHGYRGAVLGPAPASVSVVAGCFAHTSSVGVRRPRGAHVWRAVRTVTTDIQMH